MEAIYTLKQVLEKQYLWRIQGFSRYPFYINQGWNMKKALIAFCFLVSTRSFAMTKVAITIDDFTIHGPTTSTETRLMIAERFLRVLKAHHVPDAHAFVNSQKVEIDPDSKASLTAWLSGGYSIGNHAYSHMDLATHTTEEFMEDVSTGEALLDQLTFRSWEKWFRFPYLHEGDTFKKRNDVRSSLMQMGYKTAQVTVDFEDWSWNEPYVRCLEANDRKSIAWLEKTYLSSAVHRLRLSMATSRKLYGHQMKHVLLLHMGLFDSLMVERLLTAYEKEGVQFITLAAAGRDPAYREDPKVLQAGAGSFLEQVLSSKKMKAPYEVRLPADKLLSLCQPPA
jgi:peptidoglycan/xylan/chitin deacetylase (PgdA/CDA1 family)